MRKSASRTRSAVGRVRVPRGARERRPLSCPATIRITRRSAVAARARRSGRSERVAAAARAPAPPGRGRSRSSSSSARSRALEQRRVLGQARHLNSGRPVLARAEQLALAPRSSRSTSASRKPSRSRAIASSRGQRLRVAEQDAERRVLAAADPAAQLVELREPVALGLLDHHHGRVGHVDADLDHAGGHQHVGVAGGEGGHRRRACAVDGIWPWISSTRCRGTPCAARRSASAVAARACSVSDSSTSGQTTKHWRPLAISSRMRS